MENMYELCIDISKYVLFRAIYSFPLEKAVSKYLVG